MASLSPTHLSLRYLRGEGYEPFVVEHYNSHMRRRVDLLGFIDILAFKGAEVLAVQTTSLNNVPSRVTKITEHEHVGLAREAGWTVHVHGWAKDKAGHWQLKRCVDLS